MKGNIFCKGDKRLYEVMFSTSLCFHFLMTSSKVDKIYVFTNVVCRRFKLRKFIQF